MSILLQNPWDTFLGDCSVVDQYLLEKPVLSFKWSPLHFLNVLLRAVGQVKHILKLHCKNFQVVKMYFVFQPMFVNNPLCGLIILAGLFTAGPNIGCGTLLGGSVATLTEMVICSKNICVIFLEKHFENDSGGLFLCLRSLDCNLGS